MAKGAKRGSAKKNAPAPEPAPTPEPEPRREPEPEPERELGASRARDAAPVASTSTAEQAEEVVATTSQRSAQVSGRGAEDGAPDAYESMTPQQLKEECRRAGLSPDGLKEELVRRLREAAQAESLAEDQAGADEPTGAQNNESDAHGRSAAEEGDPPEVEAAPEGTVAGQMELDMTLPESEVARGALKADFIRDLAERLGVDPSRIKVTAVEEAAEN